MAWRRERMTRARGRCRRWRRTDCVDLLRGLPAGCHSRSRAAALHSTANRVQLALSRWGKQLPQAYYSQGATGAKPDRATSGRLFAVARRSPLPEGRPAGSAHATGTLLPPSPRHTAWLRVRVKKRPSVPSWLRRRPAARIRNQCSCHWQPDTQRCPVTSICACTQHSTPAGRLPAMQQCKASSQKPPQACEAGWQRQQRRCLLTCIPKLLQLAIQLRTVHHEHLRSSAFGLCEVRDACTRVSLSNGSAESGDDERSRARSRMH